MSLQDQMMGKEKEKEKKTKQENTRDVLVRRISSSIKCNPYVNVLGIIIYRGVVIASMVAMVWTSCGGHHHEQFERRKQRKQRSNFLFVSLPP